MNDELPPPPEPVIPEPAPTPPPPPAETVAQQVERAEAAATRRRWVTLAEMVGIVGLIIAGLSLWMSWTDRRADEHERQAERASESRVRTLVLLTARPEKGGERLALKDSAHEIQSIDVTFPTELGVAQQTGVIDPRIEAKWLSAPILAATDGGPDKRQGRVPVLVSASYWDADEQRTDSAIYDVVWATEGRLLRGRSFRLKGALLRARTDSTARLDAIWAAEKPKVGG